MKKHIFGYGLSFIAISVMLYFLAMKEREIIHQRAWLELQRQQILGDTYMELTELEQERAMKNLRCWIAVSGPSVRHYQARVKDIPGYHQTKSELNQAIENNFAFIKSLDQLEDIEHPDYYEKHCKPKYSGECCKNKHVTNSGTRKPQSGARC